MTDMVRDYGELKWRSGKRLCVSKVLGRQLAALQQAFTECLR